MLFHTLTLTKADWDIIPVCVIVVWILSLAGIMLLVSVVNIIKNVLD
jgi:hypothetical protein